MRQRLFGALGVWLTGVGLALAQPAPEYRPARGFYYPQGPAVYSPGMMPQQAGMGYPQPMAQPGYPMQGYAQPMYYPQPRPMMMPGAMPVQWVRPAGLTPGVQPAPYTITGPTVVPNQTPLMPPAEDAAVAAEPVLPPKAEAEKKLQPETAPPPMLPSTASPITTDSPVSSAPAVVGPDAAAGGTDQISAMVEETGKKKSLWRRKSSKTESCCDASCDTCEPAKEKRKFSLLGRKDRAANVVSDDECGTFGPSHEACGDEASRFWFAVDYLGWLDKKERIRTPLLTSGTVSLIGDSLDEDLKNGARLRMGYRVNDCWGLEASVFGFLEQNDRNVIGSNALGFPPLGRPVFDPATGLTTSIPVSTPGLQTGTVSVQASSRLYGGDLNGVHPICCDSCYTLSALVGFRYLRLEEGLTVAESSLFLDGSGSQSTRDSVSADNQFYGGQLGLTGGVQLGRFYVGTTAKGSVGWTQEFTRSEGSGVVTAAGVSTVLPALLVVPGRRSDDGVAYVGEGSIEVAYQITPHVSALVGWNILYWNKVARPGDQLSNVLNRPVQTSDVFSTSFWSQGVTASLGVRF